MKYNSVDELWHIGRSKLDGAKVGSGRYPLGSGKNPRRMFEKAGASIMSPRKRHKEKEKEEQKSAAKPTYKTMTDDELRTAINRAQLEQQYVQNLITPYRKKTGKEIVMKYVGKAAETAATELTSKATKAAVSMVLKKTLDPEIYKQFYQKK